MLADVLLCSLIAGVVASIVLLSVQVRPARRHDRGLGGSALAVLLAAAPAAFLPLVGTSFEVAAGSAGICAVLCAMWLPKTGRWTVAAHLTWAATVTTGACFVGYTAIWTVTSQLGPAGLIGGGMLWLLECTAYLLSLAYLWELIDAVGSRTWHRRVPDGAGEAARANGPFPYVSIHVPTHNEPPDMVIDTLRSLMALDYPAFEVVVLDNNTAEEQLWRPVADFCAEHPRVLRFHHLSDWPGYKSGALNHGLTVTDPRAELIAVVDADYLVDPRWLRATAPMFADARLGFVQSPQDYRSWQHSAYYRRLYHSYDYFFRVSQRSRDERDAAIFGGTMGLVRRSALTAVGGWDEWCITEDAELSLRLQKAGWSGRHVDASFGQGVMPLTFEALKGQRFRWCFGGIQILRLHWRSLLPWNRDPDNHLSRSQRLAYVSGGAQWLGDLLGLAFLVFLLVAAANIGLGGTLIVRRLSPLLLVVVPALTLLSLVRAAGGVRRAGGGTWREAFGAFAIWLSLGLTVARGCVRGALEPVGVFLRTPKTGGSTSVRDSMRTNRGESGLGLISFAAAAAVIARFDGGSTWLIAAMLLITGAGYLAAPVNSLAAMRADLPERLRRRRSTERARAWTRVAASPNGRRVSAATLILGSAATALVLLAPSTAPDSTPGLHQREGQGSVADGNSKPSDTNGTPTGSRSPSTKPSRSTTTSPATRSRTAASSAGTSTAPASTPTRVAPAPITSALTSPSGTPSATATATPSHPAPSSSRATPTPRPTTPAPSTTHPRP